MVKQLCAKAVIPKARAIFARHITYEEYSELMRRRSVQEIAAYLKTHPYFKDSLSGISEASVHRGQLEDLLSRDIYIKYESLIRYCFDNAGFGKIFLTDSEIFEILSKLQFLCCNQNTKYILRLPGFLIEKSSVDLMALAKAESFDEVLEVLAKTPYAQVLRSALKSCGDTPDYLLIEAAFKSYYYNTVLETARKSFHGRDLRDIEALFKTEAEIYNLELVFRVKLFFSQSLGTDMLQRLVLPVRYRISERQMQKLIFAETPKDFINVYSGSALRHYYGDISPEHGFIKAGQIMYTCAKKALRFTSSPYTAMYALLMLAKQEKSNIISIIEGVRYNMPPDKIEKLLKY